ncbi:MAG: DUF1385 domain-containing protein [Nitriliruptorales bacterium]|nr:DUF1385 domain-containing protein [Nitriliruptorales bacterium]
MSAETAHDSPQPLEMAPHYYGGQAVIEGVMMRGADCWAVAVRRPTDDIYLERHPVSDFPDRYPAFKRPMLRGVYALGDALAIGMKALGISADQAMMEEEQDSGGAAMGASMVVALLVFVGLFIVLPSAGVKGLDRWLLSGVLEDGVWFHLVESLARIAIFLGYLFAISFIADIRRVFQYHGAEHKTIAAWEHEEVLDPATVDRYSTLHVRCGTNFLIMVMILALIVYTLAGAVIPAPADNTALQILYHVGLRVALLPVVAGFAYESLRIGARYGDNWFVRALMKPGLWLQHITTKPPTTEQIEVAIRAFEAVVPAQHRDGRMPASLPSVVVTGDGFAPDDETVGPSVADGAELERTDGA